MYSWRHVPARGSSRRDHDATHGLRLGARGGIVMGPRRIAAVKEGIPMLNRVLVLTCAALFVTGLGSPAVAQDKHPQITAAMKSLEEAERHLEKAGSGYGGNKAKAERLIKDAQKELKQAIAFADGDKSLREKGPAPKEKK
jgi:hypothetical protein